MSFNLEGTVRSLIYMRGSMRRVLGALAVARVAGLAPCSLPFVVDGEPVVVHCGGPHAVQEAVHAFARQLGAASVVACPSDDARCAAMLAATGHAERGVCAPGAAACARAVAEHRALAARWPPLALAAEPCGAAPPGGAAGSRVLVASISDRLDVAAIGWASWRAYAVQRGYGFFPADAAGLAGAVVEEPYGELTASLAYYLASRSGHWLKLWLLRRLLDVADCYEFVVVVDDDVVVTDAAYDLAAALAELPPGYVAAGADPLLDGFNTGVLAARRAGSADVALILEAAWLEPFRGGGDACWLGACAHWDQAALASVHGRLAGAGGAVVVLPYRALQSFWNARARVQIDRRFGTSRPNFEMLSLSQIEVVLADFWTNRLCSSSLRSAADELASKPSHIEVGLKI